MPLSLEPRLGRVASKGCIRIPATLNAFLDVHGVLDADYEAAAASGERLWILKANRQTIPWPGRNRVIVDSLAAERPSLVALAAHVKCGAVACCTDARQRKPLVAERNPMTLKPLPASVLAAGVIR